MHLTTALATKAHIAYQFPAVSERHDRTDKVSIHHLHGGCRESLSLITVTATRETNGLPASASVLFVFSPANLIDNGGSSASLTHNISR